MSLKIILYEYPKCSTCRKAVGYLTNLSISFDRFDIVQTPPDKEALRKMLHHLKGDIKKLFNTSGELYREMNLKSRINQLEVEPALSLLAGHGKLIKRPFLLSEKFGLVGFNRDDWDRVLSR